MLAVQGQRTSVQKQNSAHFSTTKTVGLGRRALAEPERASQERLITTREIEEAAKRARVRFWRKITGQVSEFRMAKGRPAVEIDALWTPNSASFLGSILRSKRWSELVGLRLALLSAVCFYTGGCLGLHASLY